MARHADQPLGSRRPRRELRAHAFILSNQEQLGRVVRSVSPERKTEAKEKTSCRSELPGVIPIPKLIRRPANKLIGDTDGPRPCLPVPLSPSPAGLIGTRYVRERA